MEIENQLNNITLLDFLPSEIRKQYERMNNSSSQDKVNRVKKRNSYYFLYPDDEESEQPVWLRNLKEIVNDTDNYPRKWGWYIPLLRKAQKIGIVTSIEKWNELADSYAKQYSRYTIRHLAEKIRDTYFQTEEYLDEYYNTLTRFENKYSKYPSIIFDSTAKLGGLAKALEKKMWRRYWRLHKV